MYNPKAKKKKNLEMADLIGAVTKVTSNFLEINQVSIDNWGFKLFYKCTTVCLILASVLTTAKQFFGSPIQCDAGSVSFFGSNKLSQKKVNMEEEAQIQVK